jgi:hypothetical protein
MVDLLPERAVRPLRVVFNPPFLDHDLRPPFSEEKIFPFIQRLAQMLADHLDGILNYCRTKVRFGVVEAINGNIKTLLRRGRGYKNLAYLLLKAQRMAVTRTEFIVLQKAA